MIKIKYKCNNFDPTYDHERDSRLCLGEGEFEIDVEKEVLEDLMWLDKQCDWCEQDIFVGDCEVILD